MLWEPGLVRNEAGKDELPKIITGCVRVLTQIIQSIPVYLLLRKPRSSMLFSQVYPSSP